jgi:cell division septum initiation protein DivIVA
MELTRVYDTSQVDAYVAHLHQQIDGLNGELATLRERLALPAGPDETEAAERILGRVLLRAQQVADEAVAEGFRERDELLAAAEQARKALFEAAERNAAAVVEEAQRSAAAIVAEGHRDAAATLTEAQRNAATALADAHRGCAAIRDGAQSEAAAMVAEAEETARSIVERAHEAREMQALVDEVRGSQDGDDGSSAASPLHEVVNFPWAGDGAAPEPVPPVTPPRIVAAPPTGAPVIPLVGGGDPAAALQVEDVLAGDRVDSRRAFPFRR